MRRIKQNVYGNWYGYEGSRRVEQFFNSSTQTQEEAAREWLAAAPAPAAYDTLGECECCGERRRCKAGRYVVGGRTFEGLVCRTCGRCEACRAELVVDDDGGCWCPTPGCDEANEVAR